jgi:hypothetical protein
MHGSIGTEFNRLPGACPRTVLVFYKNPGSIPVTRGSAHAPAVIPCNNKFDGIVIFTNDNIADT